MEELPNDLQIINLEISESGMLGSGIGRRGRRCWEEGGEEGGGKGRGGGQVHTLL